MTSLFTRAFFCTCFSEGFGLRLGKVLGRSGASWPLLGGLLALFLATLKLKRAQERPKRAQETPKRVQELDFGWLLGTFWAFFGSFWSFFFGPAGLDFLFFGSTLKRGGTCAAHPPPPEGRAERAEPKSFHPSVPSSNLYASKLSLRFLATGPTPILIFPSPGPARTAALRPQFALEASKCDFLAFQKSSCFLLAFFLEKNAKTKDFDLPKPSPNPPKTPSKSMFQKTSIFSRFFATVLVYLLSWKP